MIVISTHGKKRLRTRLGMNKSSMQRMTERAYELGLRPEETGGTLRKWLNEKEKGRVSNCEQRIYGDKVYIFGDNETDGAKVLITVIGMPPSIAEEAIKATKRRKEKESNEQCEQ